MSDGHEAHLDRIARFHAESARRSGAWPAKRELAAALRELLAELPATTAPPDAIRALVPAVREAARAFAAADRVELMDRAPSLYAGMEHFHDVGPLVGLSNAIAPPLALSLDREARVVRARATFGPAYEGAPGVLHGGFLAAAFDELLGMATVFSGGPGMTRELTVRYHRPTPIDVELAFVARCDRKEGRRIFVSAEVEANGVRTAETSAVFTAVGGEKFEAFDRERRERRGRGAGS